MKNMQTVLDLIHSLPTHVYVVGGAFVGPSEETPFGSRAATRLGHTIKLNEVVLVLGNILEFPNRDIPLIEVPGWYRVCIDTYQYDNSSAVIPSMRVIEAKRQLHPYRPVGGVAYTLRHEEIGDVWHDFIWFQNESDAVEYRLLIDGQR